MHNNNLNYLYGRNAVSEAIKARRVTHIYVSKSFKDSAIFHEIAKQNITVQIEENAFLNQLVKGNHQGIIAKVNQYQFSDLDHLLEPSSKNKYPLILIVDGIQDPQNLGAIIRNAEAFNVDGLIIKKDRQVGITPAVFKVASGALENIKIAQVTNLSQTINILKKHHFWIVGTIVDRQTDYRSVDYNVPIALVIGSESDGISQLVRKNCDYLVTIPMLGQINSINASAASAIMLAHIQNIRFPR